MKYISRNISCSLSKVTYQKFKAKAIRFTMNFLSGIFGFKSDSDKAAEKDEISHTEYVFSDIIDDITRTVRRKVSWCMFRARQFQRRRQTGARLAERREMYSHRHATFGNRNAEVRHVVPAKHIVPENPFDNAISGYRTTQVSGQYTTGASVPNRVYMFQSKTVSRQVTTDNVKTTGIAKRVDNRPNSKTFSRKISAPNVRKITTKGLPNSGTSKTRSDGAVRANVYIPRLTKNEVQDRVAIKLADRRKTVCGMTSSQRIAYFRNKYDLH